MTSALQHLVDGQSALARKALLPVAYNPHAKDVATIALKVVERIDAGDTKGAIAAAEAGSRLGGLQSPGHPPRLDQPAALNGEHHEIHAKASRQNQGDDRRLEPELAAGQQRRARQLRLRPGRARRVPDTGTSKISPCVKFHPAWSPIASHRLRVSM